MRPLAIVAFVVLFSQTASALVVGVEPGQHTLNGRLTWSKKQWLFELNPGTVSSFVIPIPSDPHLLPARPEGSLKTSFYVRLVIENREFCSSLCKVELKAKPEKLFSAKGLKSYVGVISPDRKAPRLPSGGRK